MPPTRKPGASKGNKNALKHGIYSRFVSLADASQLAGMSDKDPKDELTIARINFKHAMQLRDSIADQKEKLPWDMAAHYWLDSIINAKIRSKELEQTGMDVWTTLIDATRASNDLQGIKK